MPNRLGISPAQHVDICPPHPLTLGQRIRTLASDVFGSLYEANPPALASQVAYSMVFALPSILLMVVLVAVQFDLRTGSRMTEAIRGAIRAQTPVDLQEVLVGLLDTSITKASQTLPTAGAILSLVLALWVAGGGFAALAGACARAGRVRDPRPFWWRRLISTISVLLLVILLVGTALIFVFGGAIGHALSDGWLGGERVDRLWAAFRKPLGPLLVFWVVMFLYRFGAAVHHKPRYLIPGAALATVLWYLLLRGFGLALDLIEPGSAYGAAGSLLVLLFFLYLSSLVFIAGAMLSAVIGRRYDRSR
jgi:membrane protein